MDRNVGVVNNVWRRCECKRCGRVYSCLSYCNMLIKLNDGILVVLGLYLWKWESGVGDWLE